jgi:hypothetical protein
LGIIEGTDSDSFDESPKIKKEGRNWDTITEIHTDLAIKTEPHPTLVLSQ